MQFFSLILVSKTGFLRHLHWVSGVPAACFGAIRSVFWGYQKRVLIISAVCFGGTHSVFLGYLQRVLKVPKTCFGVPAHVLGYLHLVLELPEAGLERPRSMFWGYPKCVLRVPAVSFGSTRIGVLVACFGGIFLVLGLKFAEF